MSEIVAGLIGVIAGGVVTGAVQIFQTWQDRRLKRRVAARLISNDLLRTLRRVDSILEKDRWPDQPISLDAERANWSGQREAFAAAVKALHWGIVETAYANLDTLVDQCKPAQPLSTSDRESVESHRVRLDDASNVLMKLYASRRQRREILRKRQQRQSGGRGVHGP